MRSFRRMAGKAAAMDAAAPIGYRAKPIRWERATNAGQTDATTPGAPLGAPLGPPLGAPLGPPLGATTGAPPGATAGACST